MCIGELTRGPVVVAPIGSPEAAIESTLKLEVSTAAGFCRFFGAASAREQQGIYGHVLIVGGSLGKSGAAAMAGMAALRAGAGLVTVATANSALPNVAGFAAELMTEPLPETDTGGIGMASVKSGKLQQLASKMTVVAIGPGIGGHPETVEFVHEAVRT